MSSTPPDSGSSPTPDASEQSTQDASEQEETAGSGNSDTLISPRPRAVDVAASDDDMAAAGMVLEFGEYGTFELKKRLGRGGMGEVYLAKQVGAAGFHQEVALKRVLAKSAEWEVRSFVDEARVLALLRHDSIARIHAFFELQGSHVLVMEYIEGRTLQALFELAKRKGRRLPEALVCYILSEVADALDYAHHAKDDSGRPLHIVHRDVSPANILVTETGRAKLVDFGVAKSALEGRAETSATSTTIKGKVPYLSPEQAADRPLDGRSDLFSLGCVLVEALTGEPPFGRAYDFETIKDILQVTPEHVEKATPGLSRGMKAICHKLLARVPSKRFARGAKVAEALRDYVGRPLSAAQAAKEVAALEGLEDASELPTVRVSLLPRKPARTRLLAAAGGAGLVALLASLAVWQPQPAREEPRVTASPPPAPVAGLPVSLPDIQEKVPELPAPPSRGPVNVNDQPKKDVLPAPVPRRHAKTPREARASTCAQALAKAGVITAIALTACPAHVRTGAKAGDCPFTPVQTVGGRALKDGFFVDVVTFNAGPKCLDGMERCPAVAGAVVGEVFWPGEDVFPPTGAKLFGQSRIVWKEEHVYNKGYRQWFNALGRLVVLFTELRLEDGTPVPICGVLMGSENYGGEGVLVVSPTETLNWGRSYVKLFY